MRCPQCNGDLTMPDLACVGCGTSFRGCPHCMTLVDIHETFCTSCGRPLPCSLPEDELTDFAPLSPPQVSSERLTMLELGPARTEPAGEEAGPSAPQYGADTAVDSGSRLPVSSKLAGGSGVVEDERDPMDVQNRHDPYDPYDIYRIDPFTINPYVNPHYRRNLFFAHIFRLVFALALLVFFYYFLWPSLKSVAEFEVEGIGMAWYGDALALVAVGLVLVILVYAISYFIIYRPFGRRNPRNGS